MSNARRPGLRILVGAGSFADATSALRIVQQLPTSICAGIGGILVEEVDMLAACQIPEQRIVLLSGTTSLAPSISQVRTLIQADARAFRQSLAHAAGPTGTDWAFTQDKGELVTTALRAAAGWDVLVLGYRQIHKVPGNIILLQTSAAADDEMSAAAQQLSNHLAGEQVIFSVNATADDAASQPLPNTIHFETLDDALATLMRKNAQAVLVDLQRGPIRSQNDLLRLLEAARCPVVVFGASSTASLLEHTTQIPRVMKEPDNEG